ncbi:MAG: PQQ-binding-like beta-propeller repeat protein [Polyangiales bacterium]
MRRPSRAVRSVLSVAACALIAAGAYGARVARRPARPATVPSRPPPTAPPSVGLRGVWQRQLPFNGDVTVAAGRWVVVEGVDDYAVLDAETGRVAFPWRSLPARRQFVVGEGPRPIGRLLHATPQGLRAVDLDTGATRWEVARDWSRARWPAHFAATGGLILTCDADSVTALDNRTGATRWTATAPGCVSLLVEAGRAYVHTGDALTALDARSGRRLWTARARHQGLDLREAVAASNGRVATWTHHPRGVELAPFLDDFDGATGRRRYALDLDSLGLRRDDDEARITARDDLLLLDARGANSLAHDVLMVSRDTGEVRWRAQRAWRGDYTLTDDALYAYSESHRMLLTIDPRSGRERGRQSARVDYPYATLVPVRDAPSVRVVEVRSGWLGGTTVTALAAATALPVEEVHIEGRRAWDAAGDARCDARGRVRVGGEVFSTDGRGRFSATVQARGSVAVEWLTDDDADVGGATPRCLSPEPVTVWLDGRRGPYDVTLPVDRSGAIW